MQHAVASQRHGYIQKQILSIQKQVGIWPSFQNYLWSIFQQIKSTTTGLQKGETKHPKKKIVTNPVRRDS